MRLRLVLAVMMVMAPLRLAAQQPVSARTTRPTSSSIVAKVGGVARSNLNAVGQILTPQGMASGFLVHVSPDGRTGIMITAAHVNPLPGVGLVRFSTGDRAVSTKIIARHDQADATVFKVTFPAPTQLRPVGLQPGSPDGSRVYNIGYPHNTQRLGFGLQDRSVMRAYPDVSEAAIASWPVSIQPVFPPQDRARPQRKPGL